MADNLLGALRTHLISEGIVRDPRVAGSAPPAWLEPRDGAVAPGQFEGDENDDDAVVSLFGSGGIAGQSVYEDAVFRRDTVDVFIRTRIKPTTFDLEAAISDVLIVADDGVAPRVNWTMGGLSIIQSQLWRPLSPLGAGDPEDEIRSFTSVVSYLFDRYRD